jgi:hypothetical protein
MAQRFQGDRQDDDERRNDKREEERESAGAGVGWRSRSGKHG